MERDPQCIFCKIVAGEASATVVAEDARTVAFMDVNPATRGHLLVIPKAHARDVIDVGADDLLAVTVAARELAARVRSKLHADGVNLINCCGASAWQTVFHFHVHVVPRYDGDPLRLPWLPAPGDAEEIAAAAKALAAQ